MGVEKGGSCAEGMGNEGDGGSVGGPGGEDPSGVNERVVQSTPDAGVDVGMRSAFLGSVGLVGLVGRDKPCCDWGKELAVEGDQVRIEVEGS